MSSGIQSDLSKANQSLWLPSPEVYTKTSMVTRSKVLVSRASQTYIINNFNNNNSAYWRYRLSKKCRISVSTICELSESKTTTYKDLFHQVDALIYWHASGRQGRHSLWLTLFCTCQYQRLLCPASILRLQLSPKFIQCENDRYVRLQSLLYQGKHNFINTLLQIMSWVDPLYNSERSKS